MLGGIVASLTASMIFNYFGRIKTYLALGVFEIIVSLLGLIINLPVLYIYRFLNGFIGCFYTFIAPLMLHEILPYQFKDYFNNLFYLFLTMGIMIAYSFGFSFIADKW